MIAKVFNKNVSEYLQNLGTGKNYLNKTQKAQTIRENMDKFNYIKIKNLHRAKDILKKFIKLATF